MANPDLVQQVRAYALEHYSDGGWDVIVECWEDEDIAQAIGLKHDPAVERLGIEPRRPAADLEEALIHLRPVVGVWADRQADARNSAF